MKIDRSQSTHCGKIINEERHKITGILEVKQYEIDTCQELRRTGDLIYNQFIKQIKFLPFEGIFNRFVM
jgi:hypothetical protein